MSCFPGYFHCLAAVISIESFLQFALLSALRKLPSVCTAFHSHLKLHYLKNAFASVSCRPSDAPPELSSRDCLCGSHLPDPLLTTFPSGFLSRRPCGFRSGISSLIPCGLSEGGGSSTLKRTLSTFWLGGLLWIAPRWPKLRPIRDADLAIRTIWLQTQLRTFGRFHHFWVTFYGWPDESNVMQLMLSMQLFWCFYTNLVSTGVINNCS